jgi:hypothetical protein
MGMVNFPRFGPRKRQAPVRDGYEDSVAGHIRLSIQLSSGAQLEITVGAPQLARHACQSAQPSTLRIADYLERVSVAGNQKPENSRP